MSKKLPLILATLCIAAVAVVYLVNPDDEVIPAEPPQGRACFELQRKLLPPGTQYEGAQAEGGRIRIKVMTGVELRELDCMIDSNGMPQPSRGE